MRDDGVREHQLLEFPLVLNRASNSLITNEMMEIITLSSCLPFISKDYGIIPHSHFPSHGGGGSAIVPQQYSRVCFNSTGPRGAFFQQGIYQFLIKSFITNCIAVSYVAEQSLLFLFFFFSVFLILISSSAAHFKSKCKRREESFR